VTIDYGNSKSDVLGVLRDVADLAEEAGAQSLARGLREDRIPRLEDERLHLVVLGEFNHGKTTFVNALLGHGVLPVGVTPTTAIIHHIEHGETAQARAVTESGDGKDVPVADVGAYVVGGAAAREDVRYLEVKYPAPILREGLVLVDTPGVNDLNHQRAEITYGYIPRSDAVVFLLDAGQILKESERQFISGKLLSASRDKLFFVINKIDLLDEGEKAEAIAYAKSHLAQLVPDPKVFAMSAEKAVEGDRAGSGLDAFLEELQRFLQEDRGRVLLDNALDQGLRTAGVLRTGVEVQKRAITMDQADLDARLRSLEADLEGSGQKLAEREQKVRESLAAVKAMVRNDVETFGKQFALALPQEIEESKADDLKKYLPGFIEERFREFADGEGEEVARRLERVAEEAIAFLSADAEEHAEKLRETLGPAAADLDLKVNTFAYDVGIFALGAFGLTLMALSNILVGGALALAAPVLAYVFRGRADKEVRKRAMEEAPRVVREAAGKLADAFDDQIDRFGDKLVDYLTKATEEMTRSLAEVLRTVREARSEGDAALSSLSSRTGTIMARLHSAEDRMKSLRTALWSNGRGRGAPASA
jgi:ribosome biogenesis GTPase A